VALFAVVQLIRGLVIFFLSFRLFYIQKRLLDVQEISVEVICFR